MTRKKNQETREILRYGLTTHQYDYIILRMWEKETKTAENYTLIKWSDHLATSILSDLYSQYKGKGLPGKVNEQWLRTIYLNIGGKIDPTPEELAAESAKAKEDAAKEEKRAKTASDKAKRAEKAEVVAKRLEAEEKSARDKEREAKNSRRRTERSLKAALAEGGQLFNCTMRNTRIVVI